MTKPFLFPTFEFLLPIFLNVVENSDHAFPRSYGCTWLRVETGGFSVSKSATGGFSKNGYLGGNLYLQMLIECTWSSADSTRTGAICTPTGAICTCRGLLHVIECILHTYRCNRHLQLHIAPPPPQMLTYGSIAPTMQV